LDWVVKILKAGGFYFALVFAAGFVLGMFAEGGYADVE